MDAHDAALSTHKVDTVIASVIQPPNDSSVIAFVSQRDGANGFWTVNPYDTTTVTKIAALSTNDGPRALRWAPGQMAFSYVTSGFSGTELWVGARNGSKKRITGDLQFVDSRGIQWATSDSSRMIFSAWMKSGGPRVFVQDYFSNTRDTLFDASLSPYLARLSPDAQQIAFVNGISDSTLEIMTANSDGSGLATLTGPFAASYADALEWSSDGANVVVIYVSTGGGSSSGHLVSYSVPGGVKNTVRTGPVIFNLHAVPGSRDIVYSIGQTGSGGVVDAMYKSSLDNPAFQVIPGTQNINPRGVDISGDGTAICFDDWISGSSDIYIIDLGTGVKSQITADGKSSYPTWSEW